MATNTFLDSIFGISNILRGNSLIADAASIQSQSIIQGGEISAQGAELTAQGFRQSAISVRDAHNFNLKIQSKNALKDIDRLKNQFQRLTSTQIVQQAETGLRGKSFLAIRNESADIFENAILDAKVKALNEQRKLEFQTQVQETNLENQARAADYRAAAERTLASNRAAEARFSSEVAQFKNTQKAIKQVPTLLGNLFN